MPEYLDWRDALDYDKPQPRMAVGPCGVGRCTYVGDQLTITKHHHAGFDKGILISRCPNHTLLWRQAHPEAKEQPLPIAPAPEPLSMDEVEHLFDEALEECWEGIMNEVMEIARPFVEKMHRRLLERLEGQP